MTHHNTAYAYQGYVAISHHCFSVFSCLNECSGGEKIIVNQNMKLYSPLGCAICFILHGNRFREMYLINCSPVDYLQ